MARLLDRTQGQLSALALNRGVSLLPVPATKVGALRAIVDTYSDAELAALPEVVEHKRVRPHRLDREALVLGEAIEVDREELTRAAVEAENEAARAHAARAVG